MKIIKYQICTEVNYGTETEPDIRQIFTNKTVSPWSEANEEIAKREAYNGEYTIEDNGEPEPVNPTLADHDVLNALLGVTE